MTITHHDFDQGSPEWHAARCGILTASEMKHIITPTLKIASNDKERAHLYELLGQRITGHVEPAYISDDMVRGQYDEGTARDLYANAYAAVEQVGFITNDKWGFTIGYSPDGLVGANGSIEVKSRRQKLQVQSIIEDVSAYGIPSEYMIQVQTGLLVTERKWCDFISYSGGLPMTTVCVPPDREMQEAIVAAAAAFEKRIQEKRRIYDATLARTRRAIPTERTIEQEMHL